MNGDNSGDSTSPYSAGGDGMFIQAATMSGRQPNNSSTNNNNGPESAFSPGDLLAQTWSSTQTEIDVDESTTPPQPNISAKKQQQVKTAAKGKRRRKPLSCVFCRQRKLKCDRQLPCSTCTKRDGAANCRYTQDEDLPPRPRQRGSIPTDQEHARNVARNVIDPNNTNDGDDEMKRRLDQMENLVMTMIMNKGGKPFDANEMSLAHGAGLDRERTSTFVSFNTESEIDQLGESLGLIKLDKRGKSIYHGDTHWSTLFSDVADAQEFFAKLKRTYESLNPDGQALSCASEEQNKPMSIAPFQGNPGTKPLSVEEVLASLPSRETCDVLIARYFASFQQIFPVVHKETFDDWYNSFWDEPQKSQLVWVALLLGMLSLALLSYLPPGMPAQYRGKLVETINTWLGLMETCGAVGKITIKPSLVQIRVVLLWLFVQGGTVQNKEWLEKTWIPMGAIVRMAHTMGMHRDSKWFSIGLFEAEERRRLFALVKYLDVFFALAQGLPMAMRQDDYDVDPPANCNDSEIVPEAQTAPFTQGLEVRTDASFAICRNEMVRVAAHVVELSNCVGNGPRLDRLPYNKIMDLDQKIRTVWEGYPSYFKTPCYQMNPGEPDSLVVHRFMLELEYLKTLVVLHKPFLAASSRGPKYRKSREISIEASLTILKRHSWLFQSPEAAAVRSKYWWPVCVISFQHYVHAAIFVSVYIMNHYDSIPNDQRKSQLETLEKALAVMNFAQFSPMHDSSQSFLLHVLVAQVNEVTKLSPLQRASRSEARKQSRKGFGMTMELMAEEDTCLAVSNSPSSLSEGVSPNDSSVSKSTASTTGSISGPSTGNDFGWTPPSSSSTQNNNYNNGVGTMPDISMMNSEFTNDNMSPLPEQIFDPAMMKSMSQAVGNDELDALMQNFNPEFDMSMFGNTPGGNNGSNF